MKQVLSDIKRMEVLSIIFMKQSIISIMLILISMIDSLEGLGQKNKQSDFLIVIRDTAADDCGYRNVKGDTIIPLGKYSFCFTDTFKIYAIVTKPYNGFVAIDRQEHVLYNVFAFDNGPDYVSEGVFRIVANDKIGFADSLTGKIIIPPSFKCAFPFENGVAQVTYACSSRSMGEHVAWLSNNWFYIDKKGKKVKPKNQE